MKKTAGKLLSVLLIVMLALAGAGCGTKDAGTTAGSAATETEAKSSVKSKVKFEGTYIAGDTVQVQMNLTKDGICDYGYIGMYKLATNDAGYHILNLIYYGEEKSESIGSQLAYDSYAIQQNEDGTYTRCKYTEGETPDFSNGTKMTLESGDDKIMSDESFAAEYSSDGGTFVKLNEDGTFLFGVHMKYAADKKQFEMIGASGSSVYTYETDDKQDSLVLNDKDGNKVMSLQRKEN